MYLTKRIDHYKASIFICHLINSNFVLKQVGIVRTHPVQCNNYLWLFHSIFRDMNNNIFCVPDTEELELHIKIF